MTVIAASTPPVVAPWDLPGQVAQAINAWMLSVAQSIFAFALHAITDLGRLERLHDRLLEASGWQDLLDTR